MKLKLLLDILRAHRILLVTFAVLCVLDLGLYIYRARVLQPRLTSLYGTWFEKRRTAAARPPVSDATIYRQGTADLASFYAAIAPKREFARLVGEIYETAGNNGLSVGSITYKAAVVKGEQLVSFTMSIQVSGKYAGIKSFIGDMSRLRDMLVIDGISLSGGKATEELVNLQMQVTAYLKTEGT
jgi:type IV pilus assembly protein PilO